MLAKWPALSQSASLHTTAHQQSAESASIQQWKPNQGKAHDFHALTRTPLSTVNRHSLGGILLGRQLAWLLRLPGPSGPCRNNLANCLANALLAGPLEADSVKLLTPIRRDRSCTVSNPSGICENPVWRMSRRRWCDRTQVGRERATARTIFIYLALVLRPPVELAAVGHLVRAGHRLKVVAVLLAEGHQLLISLVPPRLSLGPARSCHLLRIRRVAGILLLGRLLPRGISPCRPRRITLAPASPVTLHAPQYLLALLLTLDSPREDGGLARHARAAGQVRSVLAGR